MQLLPLVSRLSILTKDLTVEPLRPNWAQQAFLEEVERQHSTGRPVRIVVLKARQLGLSTITEAVLFWHTFLYERFHGLVVAHEIDASEHLFGMTQMYWDTFPYKSLYTPKYLSRRELEWTDTGSSIRIATAGNIKSGRGRTIHGLHASEVAFWDHAETLMLGLRQTIPSKPGTMIVMESTANGVGNYFYNVWQAAEAGETDYVPLFFPWWRHPEYTAGAIGLPIRPLERDSEERLLSKMGVDEDHLIWRRWAIKNLAGGSEDQFRQEYPATPEEAFVATGSNVFPIERLRDCYEPMAGLRGRLFRDGRSVRFEPDSLGPLTLYRMPSKDRDWGQYFAAGDPTHTTMGDFGCIQVINRRTYEQVACWRGKCDPMTFAEELAKVGTFYNDATITTEVEGPGYATVGRLIELDYPHIWRHRWADKSPGKVAETYGWSSTWKRKEWAVGWLLKLVVDRDIAIHDKVTMKEMTNYVSLPAGGYGNAEGDGRGHDDTVMALAIACICASSEGPLQAYTGPNRREAIPAWENWQNALEGA